MFLFAALLFPCHGVVPVDADTVFVETVQLHWNVGLVRVKARALDYDAWESKKFRKGVTDEEVIKGKAAAKDFKELLEIPGNKFYIEPLGMGTYDVYGRVLGKFWIRTASGEWIKVSEWMKERGHLRE